MQKQPAIRPSPARWVLGFRFEFLMSCLSFLTNFAQSAPMSGDFSDSGATSWAHIALNHFSLLERRTRRFLGDPFPRGARPTHSSEDTIVDFLSTQGLNSDPLMWQAVAQDRDLWASLSAKYARWRVMAISATSRTFLEEMDE